MLLPAASARGGVSGILDQMLQPGSSDFFIFFGLFAQKASHDDITIWFVPSYPVELTLLVVNIYVVTACSRDASIVLLKLRALKQQGRDLVMVVWAVLGSVAKFLVVRTCLTDVLLSHSPERPLDPHGRICVDAYLGKG